MSFVITSYSSVSIVGCSTLSSSLHEMNNVAVSTNGNTFNTLIDVSVFKNNSLILIIFFLIVFYFATPTLLFALAFFYAGKNSV